MMARTAFALWVAVALLFAGLPRPAQANGWSCFYCTLITNTIFEYSYCAPPSRAHLRVVVVVDLFLRGRYARTHGDDIGTALEQVPGARHTLTTSSNSPPICTVGDTVNK